MKEQPHDLDIADCQETQHGACSGLCSLGVGGHAGMLNGRGSPDWRARATSPKSCGFERRLIVRVYGGAGGGTREGADGAVRSTLSPSPQKAGWSLVHRLDRENGSRALSVGPMIHMDHSLRRTSQVPW